MKKNNNPPKSLAEIIQSRRTIRSFTSETPPIQNIKEIIQSAMFAPYGGATGIPVNEIRKIFVFYSILNLWKKPERCFILS
jgi:nitroreductase